MSDLEIYNLYERTNPGTIDTFQKRTASKMDLQTEYEKIIEDTEWIDLMETTIPYIDNIFRNPNRFIINEEEIVKIELARKVTVESIKHLAKHTNLIQDVDPKTGDVKPSKILNINKEESYDTYENRFIYTLIQHMKFYMMRKKKMIEERLKLFEKNNKRFSYTGNAKLLNENGFKAAEVNGSSKDREEVTKDFAENKYNVLCNSMLLTEGWDCPDVNCVIVLRPTKVRSLYSQMVGRGTRLSPQTGKKDLLLLDFLWHSERHELCHPANLICESEEVAKRMTKKMEEKAGEEFDIQDAEEEAKKDIVKEREEALQKQLEEMKHKKRKLVDPIQYAMSIEAEDLQDYVPSFGWECTPPTEKQLKLLESEGIFSQEIPNAGYASKLIEKLDMRRKAHLATPKQIRLLERYNFEHVGNWPFKAASSMISRIASNSWKLPDGLNPKEYVPQ